MTSTVLTSIVLSGFSLVSCCEVGVKLVVELLRDCLLSHIPHELMVEILCGWRSSLLLLVNLLLVILVVPEGMS